MTRPRVNGFSFIFQGLTGYFSVPRSAVPCPLRGGTEIVRLFGHQAVTSEGTEAPSCATAITSQ